MKNPIRAAANLAKDQAPTAEPHAKSLHKPREKDKFRHSGRPPVEMKASHGMRNPSRMVDRHASSGRAPKLPGMGEKGRRVKQKALPGPARFPDQGTRQP